MPAFWENHNYIQSVRFVPPSPDAQRQYPFSIPAVRECRAFSLQSPVTIFTGENGSGKSTILEAIAIAAGFNPEGGSRNFSFSTEDSHSGLFRFTELTRGVYRPKDGYFLRAESFYNVASNIDQLDRAPGLGASIIDAYGGRSLHRQSHGESFLALVEHRLRGEGLYLFDEPEAALSPTNQLVLVRLMHQLARKNSQFLICTHSPVLLCFPGADVYELTTTPGEAFRQLPFEQTQLFRLYQGILRAPQKVMRELLK